MNLSLASEVIPWDYDLYPRFDPECVPPVVQARINFIQRAHEQLVAKRRDIRTLADIERHFHDEEKFFLLLKRNIQPINFRCPEYVNLIETCLKTSFLPQEDSSPQNFDLFHDFKHIADDFSHICKWRVFYQTKRAEDIRIIFATENLLEARPDYKIHSITRYDDDWTFQTSEQVPEFEYRANQFFIYWQQLIQQFCLFDLPEDLPEESSEELAEDPQTFKKIRQGLRDPQAFSWFGEIYPRIPSRNYMFTPGWSFEDEFEWYMKAFIEESITLGPHVFNSDEFLPFIPNPKAPRDPVLAFYDLD